MNRRNFTLLLFMGCCAGVACAEASNLELTGLVDLGTIRAACLSVQPGNQNLLLVPGESSGGIFLQALDVKKGWALFEQGTNQIKLHLGHSAALATDQAGVSTANTTLVAQFRQRQLLAARESAANPLEAMNAMEAPLPGSIPGSLRFAQAAHSPASSYTAVQPMSSALEGSSQPQQSSSVPSSTSEFGSLTGNSTPADSAANPPGQGLRNVTIISDPEGDQIRGMFGTQAYLAWDLANADRWNTSPVP